MDSDTKFLRALDYTFKTWLAMGADDLPFKDFGLYVDRVFNTSKVRITEVKGLTMVESLEDGFKFFIDKHTRAAALEFAEHMGWEVVS